MKKLTGTRPHPIVRTERESVVKRLKQAGRAYDAGRSIEANEARIARLEARLVEIDTPPAPAAPVVEEPVAEEPTAADQGALAALAEMPADEPAPTLDEQYVEAASDACAA